MAWKQTKPPRMQVPDGYRVLSPEEKIPAGKDYKILWDEESSGWCVSDGTLAGGTAEDFFGWIAVPVHLSKIDRTKAPKAKAAKHVWTPKTVFEKFPPRTTRSDVEQMLRDAVNEINDLGTENAKLKNQIASLKKKVSK